MVLKIVALALCIAYASAEPRRRHPARRGLGVILSWSLTGISNSCLACICEVESNCRALPCAMDVGSLSCGYYQIKSPYYTDCYRPGSGWQSCARNKNCASRCVRNYMNRYGGYCTRGRTPTCQDYARIHNGGPGGCRSQYTVRYWNKVRACLNRGKK